MKSIEVKSHTNNYKKKNKNKYQNNEPSRKEKKKKSPQTDQNCNLPFQN